MKAVAAEIQPAVDLERIAREACKVNIEIQDGERLVERATEKLSERRERLGKLLIEARKYFSARGDGFVEWVEKFVGIPSSTASRYMQAAGYKGSGAGRTPNQSHNGNDSESDNDSADEDVNQPGAPDTKRNDAPSDPKSQWDIDRALNKLHDSLLKAAHTWPSEYRKEMAVELRNLAKMIEAMQ